MIDYVLYPPLPDFLYLVSCILSIDECVCRSTGYFYRHCLHFSLEYPGWEGVGVSPHDSIDLVLDWGWRETDEERILIVGKAQYWNVD